MNSTDIIPMSLRDKAREGVGRGGGITEWQEVMLMQYASAVAI